MYLFYLGNADADLTTSEFFVRGGIAIPASSALELHREIESIRNKAGLDAEQIIKFEPCPPCIGNETFTAVKENIVHSASKKSCIIIVTITLRELIKDTQDTRREEMNRVALHFDCFLNHSGTHGLILVDRLNNRQIDSYLCRKFAVGIKESSCSQFIRLERVVGYHPAAIGQSHFSSLVDIVLGSLRYAVNAYSEHGECATGTARDMLRILEPLFYRDPFNHTVHNISLSFSPSKIKLGKHRKRYNGLKAYLKEAGINAT